MALKLSTNRRTPSVSMSSSPSSAVSSTVIPYCSPEHPPGATKTRSAPSGVPCSARKPFSCSAASGVMVIMRGSSAPGPAVRRTPSRVSKSLRWKCTRHPRQVKRRWHQNAHRRTNVPQLLWPVFGSEEDQDREVFFDVDKAMRDLFGDKNNRSRSHRPPLSADDDCATTSDHVVDLILGVRRLGVARARREGIEAKTHGAFFEELQVRLAALRLLLADLAILERIHRVAPGYSGPAAHTSDRPPSRPSPPRR